MSVLGRFFGMSVMIEDEGFDSPAEIAAGRDLARFNRTTGKLSDESIVRVILSNKGAYVFGWISPHYYDPIAVKMTEDGTAQWAYIDDPNDTPNWQDDLSQGALAQDVLNVLMQHKDSLFFVAKQSQTKSGMQPELNA